MKRNMIIGCLLSMFITQHVWSACEKQSSMNQVILKDFVMQRPAGVQKDQLVGEFIMGGSGRASCDANTTLYITENNEANMIGGVLGGTYERKLDNRTAYYINTGYVFTVEHLDSGREVPEHPNDIETKVSSSGNYPAPNIRVRIYALKNDNDAETSTRIGYKNVSYVSRNKDKPGVSRMEEVIYAYRIQGVIKAAPVQCEISSKNNLTLNLPRISEATVKEKGFSTDNSAIAMDTLEITCPRATGSMYMQLESSNTEEVEINTGRVKKATVFKSTTEGSQGFAQGVGVVLAASETFMDPFSVNQDNFLLNPRAGAQSIPIYGKYYRYGNDMKVGKIIGNVNFKLTIP